MLLDVDTGVDDALAIAFAIRTGAVLLGISTVAGNVNVDLATENTRRVLSHLGADSIPVHRGASRPLAVTYRDAAHVHGENGLGGVVLPESRAPESGINGVQAILDAAARHAGELVVVATGPLTNIAMALSLRPAIVRQLRSLVIMGGAFSVPGNVTPHAEFNIYADPHAAAQVLAADWSDAVIVGLDVTHQTVLAREQWSRIDASTGPAAYLAQRIAERTFAERGMGGFYLHDPLAMAVALDRSLVETRPGKILVATDEDRQGVTEVAGPGAVHVATGVDASRFETLFANALAIPRRQDDLSESRAE
jgi:inosine-uridine nucleoside N-ribohydrolase